MFLSEDRNRRDERFDGPSKDRDPTQIQKLFRYGSPHPDATSGGHND